MKIQQDVGLHVHYKTWTSRRLKKIESEVYGIDFTHRSGRHNPHLHSISICRPSNAGMKDRKNSVGMVLTIWSMFIQLRFPSRRSRFVLITPISLDEVGSISCHTSQETLSAKKSDYATRSKGVFTAQASLHMPNAQGKQSSHGVIQYGAVGAIKFGDRSQKEGQRDILEEVHVAATCEEERIRVLMVAGVGFLRTELVSNPLLILDALVDDAIAEEQEVGGEGQGPGTSDSCDGISGCDRIGVRLRLTKHFRDRNTESNGGSHFDDG